MIVLHFSCTLTVVTRVRARACECGKHLLVTTKLHEGVEFTHVAGRAASSAVDAARQLGRKFSQPRKHGVENAARKRKI